MDTQKVNGGVSTDGDGNHRRPSSYSVETPYGFHLDLDFLKFVEDIEKGNTIRRVPIQRRPRRRSSGNLSRNLSLPGYGCRLAQWNTSFFPKSRLADSPQHYEFQSSDCRPTGLTGKSKPSYSTFNSQLEATIKAFDEQPLGHHVRPNLLRASSLPITTLLRKYSESTDDPTSPVGSRDYLAQENGSSEDVFYSPEKKTRGVSETFQQLSAALQRVGELEEEIRILPELKAQICILQEERERLLHTLQTQTNTTEPLASGKALNSSPTQVSWTVKKPNDDWMNREYEQLEKNVKASSEQADALEKPLTPSKELPGTVGGRRDPSDRCSSLIPTLQNKMKTLEQKLGEVESDLEKTRHLLKEQVQQSRLKDKRIKELKSERTTADGVRKKSGPEPSPEETMESEPSAESRTVCSDQESRANEAVGSHADAEFHVNKVKELLQEQWECVCRKDILSSKHLPPRVHFIQEQLVTLVEQLSLCVSPAGAAPPSAEESMTKDQVSVVSQATRKSPAQEDERGGMSGEEKSLTQSDICSKQLAEDLIQKIFQSQTIQFEKASPIAELTHGDSDPGAESITGTKCPEDQDDDEPNSTREPSQCAGEREPNVDFMKACYFLDDHMDEVSEPSNEMRQALTAVFQQWFQVAAEEQSRADTVALYLSEVATKTPAVLPFLVNMMDDNGNTALHYSVSHSNFSIVKLLLDTGVCEVDLKNKMGYTAVMLASLLPVDAAVDMQAVEQLMGLGDVNARTGQVGQTALHLAVRHGRATMVRLLLAHGANVNAQDQAGTTALISACDRGNTDVVQILLADPECDVHLTDKVGRSALSLATQASHTDIADLLKARTNTKGHDKCKMS